MLCYVGWWVGWLVTVCNTELSSAVESKNPKPRNDAALKVEFLFLGKHISRKCFATLLGIGPSRLTKTLKAVPDLRFGKSRTGNAKASASVEAWLAMQYSQIAETLPDRLVGWFLQNLYLFDYFLSVQHFE